MLKLISEDRDAPTPEGKRGFWMTSFWKARQKNLALHDPIDQARSEFDAWSRSYDQSLLQRVFFGPSHRLMLSQMSQSDERILDVGCGTGRWAEMVLEHLPHSQVWGLDLSEQMLHKAQSRADRFPDRLRLVQGDSESLPFETGSFDLITCSHSFHHYPHQATVVAEMKRVLKPGGRMMIVDGCRDTWWGWFIFDGLVTWAEGHVHHCSKKRMRTIMNDSGMESLVQITHKYPVPYLLTIGTTPAARSTHLRIAA